MRAIDRAAVTAAGLLLLGAVISAQKAQTARAGGASNSGTVSAVGSSTRSGQAMIHGTALDANGASLPNVTVRLRNLSSGEIEKVLTVDRTGEFTFVVRPEVPYIVEIADQTGQILAVGSVVSAQAGEVAGTTVSLAGKLPASAGLLGSTVGSVISAASGAGVTALQPQFDAPPASPER
jgi:hypothetical protein